MSKRVFIAISLLLLLSITVVAKDPNRPLRVGVLASLTGPGSSLGRYGRSAQLAAEQLGISCPGGDSKFIFLSRRLDRTLALEAIQDLVSRASQSSSVHNRLRVGKIKPTRTRTTSS
jgi:hypothetical protein